MAPLLVIVAALNLAAASCGGALAARCGTLIVPEDRLTRTGRTIPLRFVVIPATFAEKAPDPVVYFAGGPGGSAVDDIPGEVSLLGTLNLHRDLVFIDQRGTGQSNPLTCPAFPGPADKAALRAAVRSCLAHLHGDLRFYTTAMFTDDVSQLLGDLHYARADFVGISYGTTAEQVFLLRHPGQVRTLTLISGTPLNVPLFERRPGNAQLALDYIFRLCESQPACHQAFPHLATDWAALWASLGKSPWILPAAQSPTGKTERLDQDTVAAMVYQALYDGNIGPIPVVVHTLGAATDKLAAWVSVSRAFPAAPGGASSANQMMPYAIQCDEPWESYRPAALSDQRRSFYYQTDLESARWWQYVCPLIPKSAAAVGHEQLTVSAVPLLAFNGAYDPVEQPRNWAGAQKVFPGSREIALPGQGHNTTSNWYVCAGPLTQAFIGQASVAHLNTGCLAAASAPPFDLTLP